MHSGMQNAPLELTPSAPASAGHSDTVRAVVGYWSTGGAWRVASGSSDSSLRIWEAPDLGAAAVELTAPGPYHLFSRVRGKPPLQFRCELSEGARFVAVAAQAKMSPDVVLGRLLSPTSVVAVDVRNAHPSRWPDARRRDVIVDCRACAPSVCVCAPRC